jgi:hypothetical protein
MKYLLTIYADESGWNDASAEESAQMMAAYEALDSEMKAAGVLRGGEGLQPTTTATTVRVRDGERLLTDGPFAETREQLGGYYLVDCANLDEAVGWAAKIPGAASGCVEVRPVIDYEAFGVAAPDDHEAATA